MGLVTSSGGHSRSAKEIRMAAASSPVGGSDKDKSIQDHIGDWADEQDPEDKVKTLPSVPLTPGVRNAFAKDAERLGIPIPCDVKEAARFKYILMCEDRQKRMALEREVILRVRLPVMSIDLLLNGLVASFTRELDTARAIFEDMPNIDEPTKKILRVKTREWADKVRDTISSQEIDDFKLTPTGIEAKDPAHAKIHNTSPDIDSGSSDTEKAVEGGPLAGGKQVVPRDSDSFMEQAPDDAEADEVTEL
jgi:hypothetical protein